MGDWSALRKCCYCISLTIGTKAIASFFLLLTLGKQRNITVDDDVNPLSSYQDCSASTW